MSFYSLFEDKNEPEEVDSRNLPRSSSRFFKQPIQYVLTGSV